MSDHFREDMPVQCALQETGALPLLVESLEESIRKSLFYKPFGQEDVMGEDLVFLFVVANVLLGHHELYEQGVPRELVIELAPQMREFLEGGLSALLKDVRSSRGAASTLAEGAARAGTAR